MTSSALLAGVFGVYVAGVVWVGRKTWQHLKRLRQPGLPRLAAAVLTVVVVALIWPVSLWIGLCLGRLKGDDTDNT